MDIEPTAPLMSAEENTETNSIQTKPPFFGFGSKFCLAASLLGRSVFGVKLAAAPAY
jgi:hypothetical protein